MTAPDIAAEAVVPAPREEVFAFLSRLENHWRLADRWIEVLSLDGDRPGVAADGGRVRMRGPLGIGRTATTRVVSVEPPHSLAGTAEVGSRSHATVRWTLAETGSGATHVRLSAAVENTTPLDRLVLALGGRIWLRRRFRGVLARLAQRLGESPP